MSLPRLTLLLTTSRIPGGLLTRAAWRTLATADHVYVAADDRQDDALRAAGMPVRQVPPGSVDDLATAALESAAAGEHVTVVLTGDRRDGDRLLRAVAARNPQVEVDVLIGSHDLPGARVLDLVSVMDRLRSPGGCPWDARQTPDSLVPYLIEEAHEAADAITVGGRREVVDELGDVLLQVVFHARIGQEDEIEPFGLDDVADAVVAKLIRRHPHVFGDVVADSAEAVAERWEVIKAAERAASGEPAARRPLDGIPASLPPLTRAVRMIRALDASGSGAAVSAAASDDSPGGRLLAVVADLVRAGADPDALLREEIRVLQESQESVVSDPAGAPPRAGSFPAGETPPDRLPTDTAHRVSGIRNPG